MSETSTVEPRFPICETCGGQTVIRDAWAIWSAEDQDWVLGAVMDAAFCQTCEQNVGLVLANDDDRRKRRCQYLNDRLRRGQGSGHDRIVFTAGVTSMSDTFANAACAAVETFDDFTEDNDPHAEHDFGALDVEGQRLYFKVDYYNLTLDGHSPDKTDPNVTARVLTIMLAQEY